MNITDIFKRIIYGSKATSESYIAYLKNNGYKIGTGCKIYSPMKTSIDEPGFMLEIGNDVRITEGVTILCHDASVYTLDIAQKNSVVGGILARLGHIKRQLLETMFSLEDMRYLLWELMLATM